MKNIFARVCLLLLASKSVFGQTTGNVRKLKAVMEKTERTMSFQPLIDLLAPDVTFKSTIPAGTPISGEFRGKEAVSQYLNVTLPKVAVFKQQKPMEFIQTGSRVIVLGDDAYTLQKNGETHRSPYASVFTFKGGLVKDIQIIQDLSGIWNAYRQEAPEATSSSDIKGTYVLKSWRAIDGKQKEAPVQKGTLTFDGQHRIFTFVGKDSNGSLAAEMYVAQYTLNDSFYAETSEFLVLDHDNGAKPASYDMEKKSYQSPVTRADNKLRFALPHPFEKAGPVIVEFSGDRMKATIGDEFEYFWEKL